MVLKMEMVYLNPFAASPGMPILNTTGINPNDPDAAAKAETAPPLLLRDVVVNSLMAEEPNMVGGEKLARFLLAKRCLSAAVAFSAEEVALIKRLVERAYSPLIVGLTFDMIDP